MRFWGESAIRFGRPWACAWALLASAVLLAFASTAQAAPEIQLDKEAPATVLYGDKSEVLLHATNPSGQPYGYNLTFRDVLPKGVSYVAESSNVPPLIIEDAPEADQTTLIFENVSDLSPGSSYTFSYEVAHDTTLFSIGDTYTNEAGAFIEENPHQVPDFEVDGTPSGTAGGEASDSAETEISAIEILKGPEGAGKLLRGVHNFQAVYTLQVRNNAVEPTDQIEIEDWLPAGLEFLGCGTVDNTTEAPTNSGSAEEYDGSGSLATGASAPPKCIAPTTVETVETDPDEGGPMPNGIYTHVVWSGLEDLEPGATKTIEYVAAIPIRENTGTWTGATPPTTGAQAANLDNNSGTETFHGQTLTNFAIASGQFEGTLEVSAADAHTRVAKDILVEKSVSPNKIEQGEISTWTMHVRTSEYRYVENIRLEDTLPDGLCPLGSENFENVAHQTAECAPTGNEPNPAYTSATENASGSYTLIWNESSVPALELVDPSSSVKIEFPTRTRVFYQENFENEPGRPVLAEDAWINHVSVAGADFRICAPSDPHCAGGEPQIDAEEVDGTDDHDSAAAEQEAEGLKIDKTIRETAPAPVDCATGTYLDTAQKYGPGDHICWQLKIDFPAALFTGDPMVTDFLPPGTTYVPGSALRMPEDTLPSTAFSDANAGDGVLSWTLGVDVEAGDKVFWWRFATEVGQTPSNAPGELKGNLMKFSYENTAGTTFPLRDEVEFERSQALLKLLKGVRNVNGSPGEGHPANTDNVQVSGGDVVTFRVDVENEGDLVANDVVVWDNLEDGITCTEVSAISDEGNCAEGRITWSALSVAAETTKTLTYDVAIPVSVEPGRTLHDEAGVIGYTSPTNTGGKFEYVPSENLDPTKPEPNAPAANDTSSVHTRGVALTKHRSTAVGETGNDPETEATIGERIDYVVKITIPEGTTIYGSPKLTDELGSRETYAPSPAASATFNEGALPEGFSLEATGNVVSLQFPATYENAPGSGDDHLEVKFSATVDDETENLRSQKVKNTAKFVWKHADGSEQKPQAHVETTIVEPNVSVAKSNDDADDVVSAGQTLNYTVTASNGNQTDVSTAHDLVLVDHLPEGLTPQEPIPNEGVWNVGERTITWSIASLGPGQQVQRTFAVEVDEPATAGELFTNEADLTATSMEGAVEGERGPGSPVETGYKAHAEETVSLGDATLTKDVEPGKATIGQLVTYTTDVVFPAHVLYFDTVVIDTLPDGMVFEETVSVKCDGGECTPAVTDMTPEPQADGTTSLAWYLGDLPSATTARTYEITYTARVAEEYEPEGTAVLDGETLTNTAAAFYRGSDVTPGTPASIPDPGEYSDGSNSDQATVEAIEPHVVIDKKVSGDADEDDVRPTQPGDTYTYSLVVSNTGDAPAYDVEVEDTPDATRLTEIEVLDNGAANETDDDGSDGTLAWTIPGPLPAGGSVTLQYEAKLAPSADLHDGDTVVNTADVPLYWGQPKAERDANGETAFREYTEVEGDTVTLDVHLPQIEVTKTVGEGEVAEIGEPFAWKVEVSNTSTYAIATWVDVEDVLPPDWSYVSGSAELTPGGQIDPDSIVEAPAGDTLKWDDVAELGPGQKLVLELEATPEPAAAATPGLSLNVASADAEDESSASGSGDGPYADEDGAEADLKLPVLKVEKTPDDGAIVAGEAGAYEVKVSNEGAVPAREVEIEDVIGAGQTYTAGSALATPSTGFSEASVAAGPGAGETTVVWEVEEISAGGSLTIEVPVQTPPSLPDETHLTNDASVTSREVTTPVSNEGSLDSEVEADVEIVKTAQAAVVDAGEEMDFTLEVSNDGPSDAAGVTVTDVLPANLSFVSADSPCTEASGTVTCPIGHMAAGASLTLNLRVKVDPDETVKVVNTATVSSTSEDPEPGNDESTAEKPIGVEANIVVVKDGPAMPVLQGTEFDYFIDVENAGVSAATDVTLEDVLPAGVQFVSGETDVGDCTELAETVDCEFGKLEPGASAVVTIGVLATGVGDVTNTAKAETPSTETTTTDNEDGAEVEILPAADLGVTKTAPAEVEPGSQLTYDLEVVNNGPSPATGVSVLDTLPKGVIFASADPACTQEAGEVSCEVEGTLGVSETRNFEITVEVPFALGGSELTNFVVVEGNEGDLEPENDSDEAQTTVGPAADMTISKTAAGAVAGGTAGWTLIVQNKGPSAGVAKVHDVLPAGTTVHTATPSQGSCTQSASEVSCDLGTLAAGGSAQILIVAGVGAELANQTLRNHARVDGDVPDPDPTNNEAEVFSQVAEPASTGPDLKVTKTASTNRPELGKAFGYEIEVRNVGKGDAERVRVVDTLSKAVRLKRVSATAGKCDRDGSTITCSLGTISAGAQAEVDLVVIPISPGRLRNTASASAKGIPDVDPEDNGDVAGVMVTMHKAGWTVEKRALQRSVRGGNKVKFAITVRVGEHAVAEARICDLLPPGLVFVRVPGAEFENGNACWTLRYLAPNSQRTLRVLTRAERGFDAKRLRNVVKVDAENAKIRVAGARVRVRPAFGGAGGGVTG